jgi:type IX secretion system PorP/SprF family membrane protein
MKIFTPLLFIAALLLSAPVIAQDVIQHFSQYYMSPVTLNPAQAGGFEGTFRIGGIYRDQWNYIAGIKGYKTPSLFIDAPVIKGFRKQDWVGVGVSLYQDKAGTGGLTSGMGSFSGAYHLGLDKKLNTVLSIGVSTGFGQRRLTNQEALIFEDEINSGAANGIDAGALNQQKVQYSDYSGGLGLTAKLNKMTRINFGVTMAHITQPRSTLFASGGSGTGTGTGPKTSQRITAHGQFDMQLNDKWSITPAFLFQTMGGANEIAIQVVPGYRINPEKDLVLRAGVGYRLRDAVKILLGMDINQWKVGLAYDVNVSDLTAATNGHGGFELSAYYIAKIYKKPVVPPVILCPRY